MAASNAIKYLRVVKPTGQKCTASVIFMHGSGSTGDNLRDTFRMLLRADGDMVFPHIRVTYPTAPVRPYTLANGEPWNVWFNRTSLGLDHSEEQQSVDYMAEQLQQLIEAEVQSGIPLNRIVLGGFSMGGSMALYLAYRCLPEVAGVVVMGSFLSRSSTVYEAIQQRPAGSRLPPLLQFHGEADPLVRFDWGKDTNSNLQKLGVPAEFISVPKLGHSINKQMALSVREWILKRLPEEQSL